jgi:hypothetical protein
MCCHLMLKMEKLQFFPRWKIKWEKTAIFSQVENQVGKKHGFFLDDVCTESMGRFFYPQRPAAFGGVLLRIYYTKGRKKSILR